MSDPTSKERLVVAYTAGTASEAIVVRGLLESAGIHSPNFDSAEPFPLNEPSEITHGTEVYVRKSEAEEARRIIEEYLKSNVEGGEETAR